MKIVATVLLGPGSEKHVAEALKSAAGHADSFLLIESGGGGEALRAAYEAVPGPAETRHYDWVGDYGAARNFALQCARESGADYALTLDPDERLTFPEHWRVHLEMAPDAEIFLSRDRDEGYLKERLLRCSAALLWVGRVCEYMTGMTVPQAKIGLGFWEVPKSQESEVRRWERGVTECLKMIEAGDDRYRWRRHLGSSLMGLGRRAEAIEHYKAALPLASTPEETAWMRYLLCEQLVLDEDYAGATRDAATGLSDHAGFVPEFGWILSYCEMKRDNLQNASRWAQLALHCPEDKTRVGFRSKQAKLGCRQVLAHIHSKGATEKRDGHFTLADFQRRKVAGPNYRTLAAQLKMVTAARTALDFGSGQGLLVEALLAQDIDARGVELEESARVATADHVRDRIIYGVGADRWSGFGSAELVSCVEVMEHIPEAGADAAVAAICSASKRWVYFSAAAPGQPGQGHINCQPKGYWVEKFVTNGFRLADAETRALVDSIRDMQPCWWLPQNAMIFERNSHA